MATHLQFSSGWTNSRAVRSTLRRVPNGSRSDSFPPVAGDAAEPESVRPRFGSVPRKFRVDAGEAVRVPALRSAALLREYEVRALRTHLGLPARADPVERTGAGGWTVAAAGSTGAPLGLLRQCRL